jgi:YesN/AraC family two-component response regulator
MHSQAILCVDDEKSILSGLHQQIMSEYGERFDIELASSGDEALEVLEELKDAGIAIPLVITDQMMPGMKGHELIDRIQSLFPKTSCVLLTGYAESEVLQELAKNKVLRCLNKPWDSKEIISVINEACDRQITDN